MKKIPPARIGKIQILYQAQGHDASGGHHDRRVRRGLYHPASDGVGADIDTYVAHDTQECQQYSGLAQQCQALAKGRCLTLHSRFLDTGAIEPQRGGYTDDAIDGEKNTPTQAETCTQYILL